MLLPIAFANKPETRSANQRVCAGDVGATKVHLALLQFDGTRMAVLNEQTYRSKDITGFDDLLKSFLSGEPPPDSLCLGVAGPVQEGRARLTNLGWEINSADLARALGLASVHLINDLEAAAYGLALLTEKDLCRLTEIQGQGNAALIAPGTGLGEAGLYWDGAAYHPFATEGGHCSFAPHQELDVELYGFVAEKYGHVSWERLVSGPGIETIYQFLTGVKGRPATDWLLRRMQEGDPAAVISSAALDGTDHTCTETMDLFVRFLAEEAAQLCLKLKATGGLFIGGGIVPKVLPLVTKEKFLKPFCDAGRLQSLLQTVPVALVLQEKTPLLGAAYYGCLH